MNIEYTPEATDALIKAIPDNPYAPCFCGCGIKMRFVIKTMDEEKHVKKFCEDFDKRSAK